MSYPLQETARVLPLTLVAARRGGQRRGAARHVDPHALAPRLAPRRRAANERRRRREAEQLSAHRDQQHADLVACVSHELRTPLTSVIGYTELLLCGAVGTLTTGQRDMLERVAANGDRLHDLVDGLLWAATERLARGEEVDVAAVVHQVVGHLESMAYARSGRSPLGATP
jgi:signal transduction histidine kinase